MLKLKVNTRGLEQRFGRIRRNLPAGRNMLAAVSAAIAAGVAAEAAGTLAKDTGRFQRGWQQAHNDLCASVQQVSALAGGPIPLTPIGPSKYMRQVFPRLHRKYRRYLDIYRDLKRKLDAEQVGIHPNRGQVAWLKRRIDKVGDVLDRIIEQLDMIDKSGDAWKYGVFIGERATKDIVSLSRVETVHLKVYGGRGRMIGPGVAEVRNLEPHSRMVARRTGIVRIATQVARNAARSMGGAYVARIDRGGGGASIGTRKR